MRRLLAALAGVFALLGPTVAAAQAVDTGHLVAELGAQERAAVPGGTIYVALSQTIDEHWHTYWRNHGDSGSATTLTWTLPEGWKAGDFVWATPSRLPVGPLMNYGYTGTVLLPVPIQVPASARPGETVTLKAEAFFLVCEEICIPEQATLTLTLPVAAEAGGPDPKWGAQIAAALAVAPKPAGLTAAFEAAGGKLRLGVTGAPLTGTDLADAYFFPFDGSAIVHADPQTIDRGPQGLTLTLSPAEGATPEKLAGVLATSKGAWEIEAAPGPLPDGSGGLGPPPASTAPGGSLGLPLAVLFAFLGGLVLNLMPCVFPVLSMKAAALVGHAHEARGARTQGLAYLAGVVTTFLVLAGLLIALKAAGSAIGWGFQLQSPAVVAALAVVMLLVALNLSGVFEAGTSLQGVGALGSARGVAGSFLTGVLAVAVAAPCTAPFMASAMGYALTQSAPVVLLVFAALGLGLAAPFTLLAFAPALLARMPKPGAWMDTLRRVLAFPMYGAVAWLVWVLAQQTGPVGLALALSAGVGAAFAAWALGESQRRGGLVLRGLAAAAILAAGVLVGLLAAEKAPVASGAAPSAESADIPSEPWSPERLAALRAEGRPVFVNFTAAWCVTCQVNERTSLSTREVAEALGRNNAVYLKGDWTNRDPAIAAALSEHGRAGVPLYLVYGADGEEPVILPQLLTPGLVASALDRAAAR